MPFLRLLLVCAATVNQATSLRVNSSRQGLPFDTDESRLPAEAAGLFSTSEESEEEDYVLFMGSEENETALLDRERASAQEEGPPVDVWLHVSHRSETLENNVFTPISASLHEAFDRIGATIRLLDSEGNSDLQRACERAKILGIRPLIVAVAPHAAGPETQNLFRDCHSAGAYVVYYSTEPWDAHRVQVRVQLMHMDEVWEYAWGNILRYYRRDIKVRYVPPGYSRYFDVGANLYSNERDINGVGFIGNFKFRTPRIQRMYRDMLQERLHESDRIWSREDLRSYVEKYPLQLNVHKFQTCCPHNHSRTPVAMESFRMTALLSNSACVLSTPVAREDQSSFSGIIHFAEANDTALRLADLRKNVRACQTKAGRLYRERFDPLKLLNASGFLKVWRPPSIPSGEVLEQRLHEALGRQATLAAARAEEEKLAAQRNHESQGTDLKRTSRIEPELEGWEPKDAETLSGLPRF